MKKKALSIACFAAVMTWVGIVMLHQKQETPILQETSVLSVDAPERMETAVITANKSQRPAEVVMKESGLTQAQQVMRYEYFMSHLPPYLAGIDLPGRYNIDDHGNLIVDTDLKDMLDFFLETIGDQNFGDIYDLISGSMIASLQEPARTQALTLLDDYFTYLDAYDYWEHSFDKESMINNDPAGLRDQMINLQNMRQQYLGKEVADSFFGELEQTNFVYLDAQIALKQSNLTASEKLAIKKNLEESLPKEVREAQKEAMRQVDLSETTRMLQEQGASEAEIHHARVEMVGREAANRLQKMDSENLAWDRKRSSYLALLEGTPGLDGMTKSEKQAYIADIALRELGLSPNEIKRMRVLDRIEAAESIQ